MVPSPIKEINEGWTLERGVQGPGGPGVFAKIAPKPPTENIKEIVDRGGDITNDDTVWDEQAEYLVKSGENGRFGADRSSSLRPIRNRTTPSFSRSLKAQVRG